MVSVCLGERTSILATDRQVSQRMQSAGWGKGKWMSRLATGRSYGSALIPLVGNNSRFIDYSNANAYIYTNHMTGGFHLLLSLFGFLLFIYLQYITLTDYILTIPLLIRRGVCKSEHVSGPFKLFSTKCFSEDVCNLIICGTMSKMDYLGFYMMSNQMILCVDVFGSIMESRILSQLDCRSIVNQ